MRINGAPAPGGFIRTYTSENSENQFFNNHDVLKIYLNSNQSDKENKKCPGKNYFENINLFIENHFDVVEKYLEYLKSVCDNSMCCCKDFCWTGPQCFKIPKPYPDYDAPGFHYKHVSETSKYKGGVKRAIDDYQPRKQLVDFITKRGYPEEEEISEFLEKYIVDKYLVVKYLEHMRYPILNVFPDF